MVTKKKEKQKKATNRGLINYPIGDFLIRLKNAALAGKKTVTFGNSKFVKSVSENLVKEGFLLRSESKDDEIVVDLAYQNKEPVIFDIKLVSRPGLRVYISVDDLEKSRGPEMIILSTSKGILSAKDAVKNRIGGEVIAKIL